MLEQLLQTAGLPAGKGQLLGCVPSASQASVYSIVLRAGQGRFPVAFSPPEIRVEQGWMDLLEELATSQKELCDELRALLADRTHLLFSVQCTEEEARNMLQQLWAVGAERLLYLDEWRVHFDRCSHSHAS